MAKNTAHDDTLAQFLIDDKIKGMSYLAIAEKHNIPVDEVIGIVRSVYAATTITDPLEYRALLQLRIEKIIELLWSGLEKGENQFKHGEVILKAVDQLSVLHDLNEKNMTVELRMISDSETLKIISTLKAGFGLMYDHVKSLPLSKKAEVELMAWPEWVAEASTTAVEQVIYAETMEDDDDE